MPSRILKPHLVRGKPIHHMICWEGFFKLQRNFNSWNNEGIKKINFVLSNGKKSSAEVKIVGAGKEPEHAISKEGNIFSFANNKWLPMGNIHSGILVFNDFTDDVSFRKKNKEIYLGNIRELSERKKVITKYYELVKEHY